MVENRMEILSQSINTVDSYLKEKLNTSIVMSHEDAATIVEKILGSDFLRHFFNLPNEEDIAVSLRKLPSEQLQSILHIILLIPAQNSSFDFSVLPGAFCRSFTKNISIQEAFRQINGAEPFWVPDTGDSLSDSILNSIKSIIPTFLIAKTNKMKELNSSFPFVQYDTFLCEDIADFEAILKQEEGLMAISERAQIPFTAETEKSCLGVMTAGFPIQPLSSYRIRLGLIESSLFYANTLDYTDTKALEKGVEKAVSDFRALISLNEIDSTMLLLFDGVSLDSGLSIEVSDGVLRHATDYEKCAILPPTSECPLIFEWRYKDRLKAVGNFLDVFNSQGDDPFKEFNWLTKQNSKESFSDIFSKQMLVSCRIQTALLLSSELQKLVTPHKCGFWAPLVLSSIVFNYDVRPSGPSPLNNKPLEFTPEKFRTYYEALAKANLPDVTMSRFVEAFSQQRRAHDSVLDLLIVLESLLGDTTEISFKLSLCVAKLLSPDDVEMREKIYKEMKDAYGLRSGIIHGSIDKKYKGREQEILEILRKNVKELLRLLLAERVDLLNMSSQERIKAIALS